MLIAVAGVASLTNAKSFGQLLQFAISVAYAIEAVVGMVGQQKLDDGLAGADGARGMGLDFHALSDGEGTGRLKCALSCDLYKANPAGAYR